MPAEALDLFQLDDKGIALFPWKFYHQIATEANDSSAPIFWGGQFAHFSDSDHFELRRNQS